MSLLTDIRTVSDSAIEQLSGQFHDLPRPLLAAIGAGDMAVEQLAKLREQLTDGVSAAGGRPSGDEVKAFAAELPARAQKIAGEIAHNLEQFATSAPERVQQLIDELPAKASELTDSLSPNNIRGTVEGYTQFVAMIYDNLAERGSKATDKVRAQTTGIVDAPATPRATATASKTSTSSTNAPGAAKTSGAKTATRTTATRTTATRKTATRKTATGTAASRSTASTTRRTSKPAARKTAGRKSTGTSTRGAKG